MQNIFITGTDNKVGKTHIVCALLRDLRAKGISAFGFKPVACGNREEARAMREATDSALSLDTINPVYLRAAAEPLIAADLERKALDVDLIKKAYENLASEGEVVIVEGTGGWNTPLNAGISMGDIAVALELPVVLVANNSLGAANLISLTADAIKAQGAKCLGVILNHIEEEWDTASVTNRSLIERITGLPVLAELIHGQDDLDSSCVW